jgi:predicted acetyltransferase
MNELQLIEPTVLLEKEYNHMLGEWRQSGEKLVPFVLEFNTSDFKKLINDLIGFSNGMNLPKGFVPHSTFWLVNENNKILGVVNIRHSLAEGLMKEGGHIGFGIRPLERKKGYATKILRFALAEAKKLGIKRAMVTCDANNIGSEKTILNNKGKFNEENIIGGKRKLSFWINT